MTLAVRLVSSAGGVIAFFVIGMPLVNATAVLRRRPFLMRLGYGYPAGIALTGGLGFVLSHLGLPVLRWWFLPSVAIVVTLISLRGRDVRSTGRQPSGVVLGIVAGAIPAIICLAVLADALTSPVTDWDGRLTWNHQARLLRAEHTVNAVTLRDPSWDVSHPRYPVLLPVAQVLVQELTGASADDRIIRPIYALFLPAFLLVLWDQARRRAGRLAASVIVNAAALAPFLTFENHGGPDGCYSDFPLACFWGIGVCVLAARHLRVSDALFVGVMLSAAALSKNEGLVLAAIAILAVLVRVLFSGRARSAHVRTIMTVAGVLGVVVVVLLHWKAGIPNRNDEAYVESVHLRTLPGALVQRFPQIVTLVGKALVDREAWNGLWLFAVALLLLGLSAGSRPNAQLLLSLLGALSLYLIAYAATGWDLKAITDVTASRFAVQSSLPALVLVAGAIGAAWNPRAAHLAARVSTY